MKNPLLERAIIYGLALVLVVLAYGSFKRAADFEQRAERAEQIAHDAKPVIDSLRRRAETYAKRAAFRDTIVRIEIRKVAAVDSADPKNYAARLAARDALIAEQGKQIMDLQSAFRAERDANEQLRSVNTLQADALSHRPGRLAFTLVPDVGIGPFLGISSAGKPVAGIGVNISFGRIR